MIVPGAFSWGKGRKLQGISRSLLALLLSGPLLALYLLCSLLQNLDPCRPHLLGSYISRLLAEGETEGGREKREKHTTPLWLCLKQHYQQLPPPVAGSPAGEAHWGSASPW